MTVRKGQLLVQPDEHDEPPIERSTVEARQGSRTHSNFRVLLWSTIVAVLVLSALYFVFFPRVIPS